jgi:lysyl-tRNA synthetase class 2
MSAALAAFKPVLELRAKTAQAIRQFFTARGFLEVETPVRISAPALELHIDAIPAGGAYLRTSPELHMKRLLAAGYSKIFQLGPCFREGERGERHNPEFTLLEWYRADADYLDLLADTKALVAFVAETVLGRTWLASRGRRSARAEAPLEAPRIDLLPVWEILTVAQAFTAFAGWDPVAAFDAGRFDLDLVSKVEPRLPAEHPAILLDYPAAAAALARRKPADPRVAERWELYIGGLELANAFSELTDPAEQRARFEACAAERRALGKPVYPLDEEFLAALADGLPPAAGIALGVDRLVMLLAGAPSLDHVLPFR